jgi:apolipoprotein N-acyltransferase
MRFFKKVVDEREELDMLRTERVGCYVMFFGLLVAIVVQTAIFGYSLPHIAGEFTVLLVAAAVILAGDIRRGSWDYFTKPGLKAYLLYSLAGSGIFSAVFVGIGYFRKQYDMPLPALLGIFALNFVFLFIACFVALAFFGELTKRRKARLEKEYEEE